MTNNLGKVMTDYYISRIDKEIKDSIDFNLSGKWDER